MQTGDRAQTWRLGKRPALDGLRGVAVLLVLIGHSDVPGVHAAGAAGVSVFFVLSGFLITSLLVEEQASIGRVSLSGFYVRRVRRLAPAFAVWAALVAALGVAASAPWFFEWRDLLAATFYYGNWVMVDGGSLGAFAGTWSLAVEEQFYLVWPLVAVLALRRSVTTLGLVAASALLAFGCIRAVLMLSGAPDGEVYYRTDTSAVALAAGAVLAILLHLRGHGMRRTAWIGMAFVSAACILPASLLHYYAPPLAAAGGVALVYAAAGHGTNVRLLGNRVLVWFGERSYAMYLWHIPLAWVLREHGGLQWYWLLPTVFGFAAVTSELSWRFVERPFRCSRDAGHPAQELVGRGVRRAPAAV